MQIGPYKVIGEAGRGGMGTVYKATDANGQVVAIKIIGGATLPRLAGTHESARMSLVREARMASTLRHRNIMAVYDIGQHKGSLYIVMEYLDGEPLSQVIRSTPSLPLARKLQIVAEICDALNHAHLCGVIHRDIKPPNTFILRDGTVKVLDFGIAVLMHGPNQSSRAGTFPYMSPEQHEGKELDARSDIWSTGVTLYELLTSRLPFIAATIDGVRDKILKSPVPDLPIDLPERDELSQILQRALAKSADARFPTAADFAEALRDLANRVEGSGSERIGSLEWRPSPYSPNEKRYALLQIGIVGNERGPISIIEDRNRFASADNKIREIRSSLLSPEWVEPFFSAALRPLQRLLMQPIAQKLLKQPIGFAASLTLFVPAITGLGIFSGLMIVILGPPLALLLTLLSCVASVFSMTWRNPRCRHCRTWMTRRTVWARFVQSNTEVILGYRDCVAALKEDLWSDAAKLLTIHGAEQAGNHRYIDSPLRYNLEFFECEHCGDQAARLTTDERLVAHVQSQDRWLSRFSFIEAYKTIAQAKTSIAHRVLAIPCSFVGVFARSIRLGFDIRLYARIAVGVGFLVFIVTAAYWQSSRSHRATGRLKASYTPARASYTPARLESGLIGPDKAKAARAAGDAQRLRNPNLAVDYYRIAAEKGDPEAAYYLAEMLAMGWPGEFEKYGFQSMYRSPARRATEILPWYEVAGRSNSPHASLACFCLGLIYEKGQGVPRSVDKALNWYERAAKLGYSPANEQISVLRTNKARH